MNPSPSRLLAAVDGWRRLSEALDRATKGVCVALVLFMTAEVLVHVFFRYALFSPFKWGEELARLVMIWMGMLGIAIALREGEHMGLETLLDRFGPRARAALRLAAQVLVALFLLVLAYWGTVMAVRAWGSVLPALQISWTWAMLAVPVTAVLQLVHVVRDMADDLLRLAGREP